MNHTALKRFLIVLFLLVDAVLAFLFFDFRRQKDFIPLDTIGRSVAILSEKGLTVPESAVPSAVTNMTVEMGKVDSSYYEKIADHVFGEGNYRTRMTLDLVAMESLSTGDLLSFGDGLSFSFYSGGEENVFYVSGEELAPPDDGALLTEVDAARVKKALSGFFMSGYDFSVRSAVLSGDYAYLSLTESTAGREVVGTGLLCVLSSADYAPVAMKGNWLFLPPDSSVISGLFSQIDVLFFEAENRGTLFEDSSSPVSALVESYALFRNSGNTEYYLIPSWEILFEDGSSHLYNAVNGNYISRREYVN